MPVFESSRKVQVFGSSLAMTLPAFFAKANEIEKGSVLNVLYCLEGVLVLSHNNDHKMIKKSLRKIIRDIEKEKIKNDKLK